VSQGQQTDHAPAGYALVEGIEPIVVEVVAQGVTYHP